MLDYLGDEFRLLGQGERGLDRFRMLGMSVRFHLSAHGLELPRNDRQVELSVRPGLRLRLRRSDYYILFELFGVGAYDIDLEPLGPIRSVLDVGANVGLATILLSQLFPAARFICIEPSGPSYALLERNLARNVPTAVALRAAVTAEPTEVEVVEGRHPALTRVQRATDAVDRVRGATIRELLDEVNVGDVDLMKLDIEGGERDLFHAASTWADAVRSVLAEIHPPLTPDAAAAVLADHGYERVQLPALPRLRDLLLVARPDPRAGTR